MARLIGDLRPVHVVGIGMHPYQRVTDAPYVTLGLTAIRAALVDAGVAWEQVESTYVGSALLGAAPGRPMLRHLGALGGPFVHVENASATGSAAVRLAAIEVASGISDVALVVGVDKPDAARMRRSETGVPSLADDAVVPWTHFALLAQQYADRFGVAPDDFAHVAVKNHANGALNPFAQRQKTRTLDEVLGGPRLAGSVTPLQATSVGEGAAAVVIVSEDAIRDLGLDAGRAVRIASSAASSERAAQSIDPDTVMSAETINRAMREAQTATADLDVVEFHEAFTVEEALYAEAAGLCAPGTYLSRVVDGEFDIGGRTAISASGGLIAMGHPGGPTGIGQIVEIVRQLRGEAGARQHAGASTGLAHMVGVGAVCYVHVLRS
ncbi:thiolase family protein [Aeromicrobium sp. CFBP 8757]|uniref:thiolase family protein n=1 Tax=Aeromicrobium sp. CFBP 8757 TaxID=2775288 RepID=UPI00177F6591|nr:thiolase family protein [Aeromicrobium sp. CFBP 8757]MBD8605442.1 thiolase family protein [Aeromicrobium sp. CFBP 8757]